MHGLKTIYLYLMTRLVAVTRELTVEKGDNKQILLTGLSGVTHVGKGIVLDTTSDWSNWHFKELSLQM